MRYFVGSIVAGIGAAVGIIAGGVGVAVGAVSGYAGGFTLGKKLEKIAKLRQKENEMTFEGSIDET